MFTLVIPMATRGHCRKCPLIDDKAFSPLLWTARPYAATIRLRRKKPIPPEAPTVDLHQGLKRRLDAIQPPLQPFPGCIIRQLVGEGKHRSPSRVIGPRFLERYYSRMRSIRRCSSACSEGVRGASMCVSSSRRSCCQASICSRP